MRTDTTNKTLRLKAYFDPTLVGAEFTLNATEGIEYNVYFDGVKQDKYTVRTDNVDPVEPYKFVAVPFGTTVRVEAHTVLVNGKEGYAITDATKGNFELADEAHSLQQTSLFTMLRFVRLVEIMV